MWCIARHDTDVNAIDVRRAPCRSKRLLQSPNSPSFTPYDNSLPFALSWVSLGTVHKHPKYTDYRLHEPTPRYRTMELNSPWAYILTTFVAATKALTPKCYCRQRLLYCPTVRGFVEGPPQPSLEVFCFHREGLGR